MIKEIDDAKGMILILTIALINFFLWILQYKKKYPLGQEFSQIIILGLVFEYFQQTSLKFECFFIFYYSFTTNILNKQMHYYLISIIFVYTEVRFSFLGSGNVMSIVQFSFVQLAILSFCYCFSLNIQDFSNNESKTNLIRKLLKNSNDKIMEQCNLYDESQINYQNASDIQILQQLQFKKQYNGYDFPPNASFSQKKGDITNKDNILDITNATPVHQRISVKQGKALGMEFIHPQEEKLSPTKFLNRNLNKVYGSELVSIWKCLGALSTGIVFLNGRKEIIYKTKSVKQLIGKSEKRINFIQYLLSLPLSLNNKCKYGHSDSTINNSKKVQKGCEENDENILKEERTNTILYSSRKRINKQKTQIPKLKGQYEQYGSVIYNLYNSQKQSATDVKQNTKSYKKMASVEVFSKDRKCKSISPIIKKQKEKNSSSRQLILKESDIEISAINNLQNNILNSSKQQQQNLQQISLLSQTNIMNQAKHQMNTNVSLNNGVQLLSSPKMVNLLSSFQGLNSNNDCNNNTPIINSNLLENQLNSSPLINSNNIGLSNFSKIRNEGNQSFKNLNNYQSGVYGQRNDNNSFNYLNVNVEDLKQKLIKCVIPDNIDRLFQEDDLILEDVVDYLINNSVSLKQPKFNTDYQLNQQETQEGDFNEDSLKSEIVLDNDDKVIVTQTSEQFDTQRNRNKLSSRSQNSRNAKKQIKTNPFEEEKIDEEDPSFLKTFSKGKSTKVDLRNNPTSYYGDTTLLKTKSTSKLKKSIKKKEYNYFISNNYLHIQSKIIKQGGIQNDIEFKLCCLISSDSDEKFVLIEIQDITRLKKSANDESLRDYKNKMLSSISHELRTPLNCSIQLLDLLTQNEDVSEVIKQVFINPALYSNQLLLNIINDILDLAQINYGSFKMQFQQFELPKICAECLNLVSLQAMQKNLTLELELDPFIPEKVNSDPSRIRQVLLNLLNNSLKFTQKGMVSIKAYLIDDNLIQIDVQDTGCGIPKQNLSKIIGQFGKEYQQTDKTDENNKLNTAGAGLGLTIANNLAAGLGGNRKLKVQSIENEGSIFSFCIVNHPLNQIGCTFEEKSLFSKQFINWECFSQYSQQQINPTFMNRKSELLSQYNPLSSSHFNQNSIKKKNNNINNTNNEYSSNTCNIRNSDATQTILQFNNDIMINSYSNQGNYFCQPNQQAQSNDPSQKTFDNTDGKSYNQEGSIKKRKYKMQLNDDQNSLSELRSPQLGLTFPSPSPSDSRISNQMHNIQTTHQLLGDDIHDITKQQSSFCSIEEMRRKSVNDAPNIQLQNGNNFVNGRDSTYVIQPIRFRTNSVLIMPTSITHIDMMKNSIPAKNLPLLSTQQSDKIQHLNVNMQTSIGDKGAQLKNESSLTSINDKFFKYQCTPNENSEGNNLFSKQKFQQTSNSFQITNTYNCSSSHQTSQNTTQTIMLGRQYSNNSNPMRIADVEEDSCNIKYAQESHNKRMPNEFSYIQLQHKSSSQNNNNNFYVNNNNFNQHVSRQSLNSQYNEDSLYKRKSSVQDMEDWQNQKNNQMGEYHLNLIYDGEQIQNQKRNSNYSSNKNLSQINETQNESESFCVAPQQYGNQQKINLFQQPQTNEEDQKRQTSKLLQLPPLKTRKRESKEDSQHSLQISPKKQQQLQQLQSQPCSNSPMNSQSNINIQGKIDDKSKITKQMKIQSFNRARKCKCPNILIVDDNEFNIYALDVRLQSYGFVSDKATDGIKALEFVKKKYEQTQNPCCPTYQIIFMDIDMPIKNGYETTKDILDYFNLIKLEKPTPISACSAYVQESEKIKAKKVGMQYYITKPINQQSLEHVIETCLTKNSLQN